MPFTFSHPAAVIPVHRLLQRRAVLSALIIGSMVPDFQYFLPFDVDRGESHSAAGILWFCLPVAMGLYLVFHLLLKKPMIGLLPPLVGARLNAAYRNTPLLPQASGLAVAASLLAGILTHLAWDAFTHYSVLTAFALPSLSAHLFSVGSYHVYPYKVLQHVSTVGGALLLWHWSRRWLAAAPVLLVPAPAALAGRSRRTIIGILLTVPLAIGLWLAIDSTIASHGLMDMKDFVREAVITSISGFGMLLIAYSMVWHAFFWQKKSAQ